jgi:hypothetical protein
MTKIIRLTESDLEMIVKQVLKEQSKGKPITAPAATLTPSQPQQQSSLQPTMNTDAGRKLSTYSVSSSLLPCVPAAFKLSIQNFLGKNYDKTFLKAVLGIIGRESDFGESKRFKFTSPLKSLWAALGGQTSVGYAQIKPETAEKYGIKMEDLELASGSVEAAYKILQDNYNLALKNGYTTQPSVNLKDGTGNSALDLAIAAYNLGASKITKYCETSDPNIKKPCSKAGQTIVEQKMGQQTPPKVKSIVVTNRHVPNYIPNFKTERWDGVSISSHGYISEVAKRMKGYTCF